MEIELSPEAQRVVAEKVASGEFAAPADVVEAAVRLLAAYDAAYWAEVRAEVAASRTEIAAGLASPFDPAVIERVKAEGRRRVRGGDLATG
ncbi:MAG: hypothetical protein HYX53_08125 [Chloroflexi bacterium]|nr:hypothetical protein [Chloroflexota bacterium]